MTRFLLVIFAIASLSSCSLQKRNYRSGYYFEWVKAKKNNNYGTNTPGYTNTKSFDRKATSETEPTISNPLKENIYASAKQKGMQLISPRVMLKENCDTIVFHKKKEKKLICKVVEVTDMEVRYRDCNDTAGGIIVIPKDRVSFIGYGDGKRDFFSGQKAFTDPTQYSKRVALDANSSLTWAIISLLLVLAACSAILIDVMVLFLPVISIAGFFTGRFAWKKGRRALDKIGGDVKLKEKYEARARFGKVLGLTTAILFVVAAVIAGLYLISSGALTN